MEQEYIKDVQEWLKWYNWHRSMLETMPLERKVEFLLKANYGCIKLLAGLVDQALLAQEGRKAAPRLLLPVGVRWGS
jgi:hypothetical protein